MESLPRICSAGLPASDQRKREKISAPHWPSSDAGYPLLWSELPWWLCEAIEVADMLTLRTPAFPAVLAAAELGCPLK